jgi:GH25 family lysozyme M1 (1,4-beta-N-acetylmuramidase)
VKVILEMRRPGDKRGVYPFVRIVNHMKVKKQLFLQHFGSISQSFVKN